MNRERLVNALKRIPLHVVVISMVAVWLIPTLGVFVTSFRSRQAVRESGWWTVVSRPPIPGTEQYGTACASCHGSEGNELAEADLSNPDLVGDYTKTNRLLAMLREEIDGQPHVEDPEWQSLVQDKTRTREALDTLAPVSQHLSILSGSGETTDYSLSLTNWIDALVGYKGTTTYQQDCSSGVSETGKFACDASDLLHLANYPVREVRQFPAHKEFIVGVILVLLGFLHSGHLSEDHLPLPLDVLIE